MPAKRANAATLKKRASSKKMSAPATQKKAVDNVTQQSITAALAAARMGIWEWNVTNNELVWSEQTYLYFGFSKPFPVVTMDIYQSRIHPDDMQMVRERILETLQQQKGYHVEHRIVQPGGNVIWIEAAGNLTFKNGKPFKLVGTVWDITDLKKSRSRLQSLDQLFTALSVSIHELFLNNDWEKAVVVGLKEIGEATLVDRVYLFQNNQPDGTDVPATSQRFEWNSGVAEPQIDNPELQNLPSSEIEPSWSLLARNEPFFHIVREMNDNSFKRILQDEDILSILLFPIFVQGQFWGFIGFDECKYERQWTEVEFSVLGSFATSIASALERKLFESEKADWKIRYELVSAASGQVIYDYDLATGKILWGGNISNVLGYTEEEMGDIHRWAERLHPDDRDRCLTELSRVQERLQPYDVEYRFQALHGRYVPISERGFFIADASGKAYRMLGMMSDITHRKIAEEALVESEQRFRSLQQASFGGIGIHDKGKIIDCNQGLCDITGYTQHELIGMNGLLLIAEPYRDLVLHRITTGYEKAYDLEGIRKDGTRYFLEVRGKNIPYQGQQLRVTEFRDITDRKKAEQEIFEQNTRLTAIADNLRRKNEQLEEFTQIVSHNLRSPVGNILSLLEFYDTAKSEDERKEYITLLKESGKKTLTTLHDLHEVLSIKQHKNIERENLSFDAVCRNTQLMLQAKIIRVNAAITTHFEKAPMVSYPRVYLESIILNLLSNALKYHDPKKPCKIELTTYSKNGQVSLECRDNGLGIDLERYGHQVFKMRKVFHPNPESRGIGLFLIKNQIETMGGEITVQSEPGVGSVFTVIFNKFAPDYE